MNDRFRGYGYVKKIVAIAICCSIGIAFGVKLYLFLPASLEEKGRVMAKSQFEDEQINEVNLSTGIEFPWNYGWTPAISSVPGLPIRFNYENKDFSIDTTADDAVLLGENESMDYTTKSQPVQLKSGDTIYWQMRDQDILSQKSDVHYVNILIREKDNIVGYAVVKIQGMSTNAGGKAYFASLTKNVFFPISSDGQYQPISEDYVWKKIKENEKNK